MTDPQRTEPVGVEHLLAASLVGIAALVVGRSITARVIDTHKGNGAGGSYYWVAGAVDSRRLFLDTGRSRRPAGPFTGRPGGAPHRLRPPGRRDRPAVGSRCRPPGSAAPGWSGTPLTAAGSPP